MGVSNLAQYRNVHKFNPAPRGDQIPTSACARRGSEGHRQPWEAVGGPWRRPGRVWQRPFDSSHPNPWRQKTLLLLIKVRVFAVSPGGPNSNLRPFPKSFGGHPPGLGNAPQHLRARLGAPGGLIWIWSPAPGEYFSKLLTPIYIYIYIYILYLIENKSSDFVKKTLRRDLATNLATEPCDVLATCLATETLRRGVCLRPKPCDGPCDGDLATALPCAKWQYYVARLCFKVCSKAFLRRKP